jgi:hypothetical protein
MAFDDAAVAALVAALISPAQRLGIFDRVNGHEPKSAPASGITCSYFLDYFGPMPARSGLDRTSMILVFQARIQTSMLAEPADSIDPNLLKATAGLMLAYHGDFDLGVTDLELDLLGMYWQGGLAARAGYVSQGSTEYRAMIVSIPVITNDAFLQAR